MSLVHRHAEALREVADLRSQIAVMRVGYNGALKERDQVKADLASSVKHGQDVVAISNEALAEARTLENQVEFLKRGDGLEPCYEDNGCDSDNCAGGHRTMAEVCAKLTRLETLARECAHAEYLCEICSKVTRELRS